MEPLSKPLTDWLIRLNLCTRADLRRCQRRVRQLARDVPAFDSVWIDALVHARKLTPFQARLLESGRPEQLAVGPCVLVDRLGQGGSATYLARHHEGDERCVLKMMAIPKEQAGFVLDSLRQLVERAENLAHPLVVVPKSCLAHQEQLVTVSRYAAGPPLNQLLIRRGRFPAEIVLTLAKQLIDGLAALEGCGIVHGDLRLSNLRLASSGRVVMVDAGIAPAVRPELSFHARISPDRYDGVAPELIGTGCPPDVRSDFYALGCLLWQLLAGRPPFPTGDPLAKLAAHQTRRVPDVRDIAPDTPAELADILKVFTDPDPERRPPSFRAFRERWGGPKRSHRRRLRRFRALFNTAVPHIPAMMPEPARSRWPMVAALVFLLSGASLCLMDAGAYARLLAIPEQVEDFLNSPGSLDREELAESAGSNSQQALGKPLPAPDADGVIELPDAGPYRFRRIDAVGPLTIRGPAGRLSEILIETNITPCQISAADVVLENLRFRPPQPPGDRPLFQVTSTTLLLNNCELRLAEPASEPSNPSALGIAWQPVDPANAVGSRVGFANCAFSGSGTVCRLQNRPGQITIENCLKTDAGVLLDFPAEKLPGSNVQLNLSHLTLRGATGLLRCELGSAERSTAWRIRAEHCVFDLHAPPSAVFRAEGPLAGRFFQHMLLQGRNCLLNESAAVGALLARGQFQPVDPSTLTIEGLVLARLVFAGPQNHRPADSELTTWQGPRFSAEVPGIVPDKLPRPE